MNLFVHRRSLVEVLKSLDSLQLGETINSNLTTSIVSQSESSHHSNHSCKKYKKKKKHKEHGAVEMVDKPASQLSRMA